MGPARRWALLLLFALFVLAALWPGGTRKAVAQTPPPTSAITIVAHDLATNAVLPEFTFLVNVDNAHLGDDSDPMQRPGVAPTESNSPVVALGDQDSATVSLPDGRYLISIRSPDHKMWGKHITVAGADQTVDIALREGALPAREDPCLRLRGHELGQLGARRDRARSRRLPHHDRRADRPARHGRLQQRPALRRRLRHRRTTGSSSSTTSGRRRTSSTRRRLTRRATTNPDSRWVQTSTFDGGFNVQAGVEEGSDGTGAPGEQLWEPPNVRTGYWFGFACFPTDFDNPGTGEITGRALNWVGWPPFDVLVTDPNEPVQNPYIALSDSTTDVDGLRRPGRRRRQLRHSEHSRRHLQHGDLGRAADLHHPVLDGDGGGRPASSTLGDVGVSRWFGWLSGDVYLDENGNQIRDNGEPGDSQHRRRPALARRVGQGRHVHRPHRALRIPDGRGRPARQVDHRRAGLRTPRRDRRDGLRRVHGRGDSGPDRPGRRPPDEPAPHRGPPGSRRLGQVTYPDDQPGQIVGITIWGTTRNEMDARMQATEGYEPAVPDVTVRLESVPARPRRQPSTGTTGLRSVVRPQRVRDRPLVARDGLHRHAT